MRMASAWSIRFFDWFMDGLDDGVGFSLASEWLWWSDYLWPRLGFVDEINADGHEHKGSAKPPGNLFTQQKMPRCPRCADEPFGPDGSHHLPFFLRLLMSDEPFSQTRIHAAR